MFKKGKKRGQSTLEYLVLVAAVIGVLVVFLNPSGGFFSKSYNRTLELGVNGMEKMANRASFHQ